MSWATGARFSIHGALWLLAFVALALLLRRPLFAVAIVAAIQLALVVVSKAKERVLREPLVFADLALFSQAFRHPRLYFPYLGWPRLIAAVGAFALALAGGLLLEDPSQIGIGRASALLVVAVLMLAYATTAARVSLDPERDVAAFGVLGAMWLYWIAERRPVEPTPAPFAALRLGGDAAPDVVVVRSESFFDARRLDAARAAGALERFDALRAEGASGTLAVPVWGAYTMRTEFAFLSGIASERLGVHRFNPYQRLAKAGVPTVATALRERGYRTVCVHPYPASFFGRDRVFPAIGFDEFIDSAAFGGAPRDGAYVADAAVSAKVVSLLEESRKPLFLFVITMENHGPLHLETAPDEDELGAYLRHLKNADAMFGELAAALARKGDGVLCVYGDHVPGIPEHYAKLGYEDPRTDYLVWRAGRRQCERKERAVEELALTVLDRAGLAAAPA